VERREPNGSVEACKTVRLAQAPAFVFRPSALESTDSPCINFEHRIVSMTAQLEENVGERRFKGTLATGLNPCCILLNEGTIRHLEELGGCEICPVLIFVPDINVSMKSIPDHCKFCLISAYLFFNNGLSVGAPLHRNRLLSRRQTARFPNLALFQRLDLLQSILLTLILRWHPQMKYVPN
jgi:hypothetical protein